MRLGEIGFYTLSDYRAKQASTVSPLWRCELLLTGRCNFNCEYCRGLPSRVEYDMPFWQAEAIVEMWLRDGLRNIRFSGGEPTLYDSLIDLVRLSKLGGVGGIAISTNGSADINLYKSLLGAGVNDISVSLDACCASDGDKIAGAAAGSWCRVVENIKQLSALTYLTVGLVVNEDNLDSCVDTVLLADGLGVSDIRIIPSAQYNKIVKAFASIPDTILNKYPILKYRVSNIRAGRHVRGIGNGDSRKCWLALDDMAVVGDYHYPCIIYLREGGEPIGRIGPQMRKERKKWIDKHDTHDDPICHKNCLDVCIDYCNKKAELVKPNPRG